MTNSQFKELVLKYKDEYENDKSISFLTKRYSDTGLDYDSMPDYLFSMHEKADELYKKHLLSPTDVLPITEYLVKNGKTYELDFDHYLIVRAAILDNKKVPKEVLNDYIGLIEQEQLEIRKSILRINSISTTKEQLIEKIKEADKNKITIFANVEDEDVEYYKSLGFKLK